MSRIKNFLKREEGQTFSEYALILVLLVVVAMVGFTPLGNAILGVLNQVIGQL